MMQQRKALNKESLSYINGIRVFLFLTVFVSHFYCTLGGRYVHGIRVIGASGPRAVDVFFFLTGFFTLLSYDNRKINPAAYFGHKLKRLYPEYIPALLIAFITLPLVSKANEDILVLLTGNNIGAFGYTYSAQGFPSIKSFLLYLFFCNGIIPTKYDNFLGVAWCMPVEVWFYLLFCLLMLFSFKNGNAKTRESLLRAAFIVSLVTGTIQRVLVGEDAQQTLIRSLPVMFMGVLMAEIYMERPAKKPVEMTMMVSGLIYLFLLDITQNWMSVGGILVVVLLLLFPDSFIGTRVFLSKKIFIYGGKISFSFYLIHRVFISLVFLGLMAVREKTGGLSIPAMILIAFPVSLTLTVGYSFVMERFAGVVRSYKRG